MIALAALAALSIELGKSVRQGDYSITLAHPWGQSRHVSVLVQFIDEGQQPNGLPNVNRALNTDLAYTYYPTYRLSLRGQAGLTSSYFSHNGCSKAHHDTDEHIRYRNSTGLTGQNAGLSLDYRVTPRLSLSINAVAMRYQQSDKPAFETFTYTYVGIGYSF